MNDNILKNKKIDNNKESSLYNSNNKTKIITSYKYKDNIQ